MTLPTRKTAASSCEQAWSLEIDEVLTYLEVDPSTGLNAAQVAQRLSRFGYNQLQAKQRRHVVAILLDQLRSIVVLLLLGAAALAFALGDTAEGLAIAAVIVINTGIGFFTEWRAIRSMEALARLGRVETVVIRDGVPQKLPAEALVPGDIVIRESGDIVTADLRLIEAAKLEADESTLTGESMPVTKETGALDAGTRVMDRRNMLFKGTAVTRGSGRGVVVATGTNTELGRISTLVSQAEAQETPLEKRLDRLAQILVWVVLVLAALIAIAGVATGRDTALAIEVAIALAVASIPEGLPIVATIALARGMYRLARQNALIARLSAVETLGATSIILTDKTGTLTENRMAVTAACLADIRLDFDTSGNGGSFRQGNDTASPPALALLDELLTVAALCSNASIETDPAGIDHLVGDPTEVALLTACQLRSIDRKQLLERWPETREFPFDPDTKRMATAHRRADGTLYAVKGAPESILPLCRSIRTVDGETPVDPAEADRWLRRAGELAATGLRTLALATRSTSATDQDPYRELTLLGIVGLEDPPRAGVHEAIRQCLEAGISVVMVTGDHGETAVKIASEVGIVEHGAASVHPIEGTELDALLAMDPAGRLATARVFSRVTPEQKLRLIDYFQHHQHVVAMTGDGVNDAPALKKADIGVAMGIRGTDVARDAAAMVLQDDEFRTIVQAITQGRAIFGNIRKFVVYLMSCNISEVLIVSIATVAGAPLPLLPLQILFLNLVTDVFPALALGVGEGSGSLMREKPRPFDEPVLTRRHWVRIGLHGLSIAATVLVAMTLAVTWFGFSSDDAVTVSFCTLALAQVWHVFNMREEMRRPVSNEITRNPWIWVAIAICLALLVAATYVPVLSGLLQLSDPGANGWLLILGMSFVPLVLAFAVRKITGG